MPREEAQEATKLLFISAGERQKLGRVSSSLSGSNIVLTANAAKVQISTGARYTASEKINYKLKLTDRKSETDP